VGNLASTCAEYVGEIRAESIVWLPDGTAVAFSLDHVVLFQESDIFVYEVDDGQMLNLTDDGFDGMMVYTADPGVFVDGVPAWSPDSRELVFVRSVPAESSFGTVIMRISRGGGEPMRVHRIPLEMPYGIFMPMHWLPDDSLLYTQVSLDATDPGGGVWRVGLDGASPLQIVPGSAESEIPGAMLVGADPARGQAIVFAILLSSQFGAGEGPLLYSLVDIASGERTSFPVLPASGGGVEPPVLDVAHTPDASAILLVTLGEQGVSLVTMDPVTLVTQPVAGEPLEISLLPQASLRWTGNDTVLLHAAGDLVLLALEPAA